MTPEQFRGLTSKLQASLVVLLSSIFSIDADEFLKKINCDPSSTVVSYAREYLTDGETLAYTVNRD